MTSELLRLHVFSHYMQMYVGMISRITSHYIIGRIYANIYSHNLQKLQVFRLIWMKLRCVRILEWDVTKYMFHIRSWNITFGRFCHVCLWFFAHIFVKCSKLKRKLMSMKSIDTLSIACYSSTVLVKTTAKARPLQQFLIREKQ